MQIVYQGQHQSFESLYHILYSIAETTGLNATKDELIQISAVKIEKGEKLLVSMRIILLLLSLSVIL